MIFLAIAVLGAHANAASVQLGLHARGRSAPNPVIGRERRGGQVLSFAQVNGVAGGVDARHIHGMRHRDAQALALADGVAQRAVVAPDHAAVAPHNVARCSGMSAAALDIARVVAVGNKADVLAFGLLGVGKALLGGYAAHVALFVQACQRKDGACQALLRKRIQKVALVLFGVLAAVQLPCAVGRLARLGVVTRGDIVAAHVQRGVQQRAKLDVAVADDAGVGRQPLLVGGHKALDYAAVERLLQVEHVVGNADALGNGLRVGDVAVDLAHACYRIGRRAGESHGGANAFVALAFEQVRGHAGIDAAAHGDEHALVVHGEVLLGGMRPKKKSGAGGWFRAADIVASSDAPWDILVG